MIFVTVGTTHFDALIAAVDAWAERHFGDQEILFQIGSGKYEPRCGRFFRFRPSIDDELAGADLVISHGGATVFSLLATRKRFVAVANTSIDGNHQARFLRFLGGQSSILWTDTPETIQDLIPLAMARPPAELHAPSLKDDLRNYILGGIG